VNANEPKETAGDSKKPLVFVSHDSRDGQIAEKFCELIERASLDMLQTFCSSDRTGRRGLEYGVQWFQTIFNRLESASAVVCLLTARSIGRPWILYEASVAAGKLRTPVTGLVLGLSVEEANQGPFAQFQNCAFDSTRIAVLISDLIRRFTPANPMTDTIRPLVDKFVQEIKPLLEGDSGREAANRTGTRVLDSAITAQMFEEIKEVVLNLPRQLRESLSRSEIPLVASELAAAVQAAREIQDTTKRTLEADAQQLHDRVAEIHSILKEQLGRIPAIPALQKCGILNIHEDRPSAEIQIIDVLKRTKSHVEVAGISLRGLFQGGGRLNKAILNALHAAAENKTNAPVWRVMVLDPESDQARYRTEREEPGIALQDATLYREVNLTIKVVEAWKKQGCRIELKAYKGSPSCFLMILDDVIFAEQYHYGRAGGARVAELVPIVEYSSDSTTYRELVGHFDYMWEKLARPIPTEGPSARTAVVG
jgi:hypothetical protein